jgi:hypothetical protein
VLFGGNSDIFERRCIKLVDCMGGGILQVGEAERSLGWLCYFETPHNFDEGIEIRKVDHQIIIDAMDGQCQVHSIRVKCPKQS